MEYIKQLIRAAIREEIRAALDDRTRRIVATLNAHSDRLERAEDAVGQLIDLAELTTEGLELTGRDADAAAAVALVVGEVARTC